ncbi:MULTISPECIES: rRNA maturation RNase YbeY [Anaerotruncus]|uniref:Endoribonuclease YbeY n=2 Tax=Anaerotruncus TaxID=244127 RepID=A0A498CTD4_9FIRM|nr:MULTISPECIES: rRNA maturation RNase YbeY [Anaerotruncus]MBC3937748.1 rRNA maturation RNase YbeY [Anaerotruncus massiliensis (ex Togo et al. 2019)]MCQ4895724.1 rRNA maturation RNase YbeY [Anaerotruncus sp. DFI.9.16]RLL14850.1 rRNA maturation RNase YbeY [Anaerotruncus massiliensis (ex Liu et al. 2021)]
MTESIKVLITNRQKDVKIPSGIRLLIRRCCHAVLAAEQFGDSAEVSVSFVNNEQIRQLNNEFRQKDAATDVLSFPLGQDGVYDRNLETGALQLGDIVISIEKAVEQARIYGHSLQREIGFLTVHSMLHLLGYDHESGGLEMVRMREKEESVLSSLGLQRDGSYVLTEDEI